MIKLYACTLLVGAFLLFWVQLFLARMTLPLLGGAPATWNTCMVFFQLLLLGGYGYAHVLTSRLAPRSQVVVHIAVMLLPLVLLPVAIPEGWTQPGETHPIPWLLGLLSLAVGLPFFAVAATAPLIQRWFSQLGDAESADPYFLYAASNLGSLLSLLAYPLLLEPAFSLPEQSRAWSFGYALLLLLQGCCALVLWKRARTTDPSTLNAVAALDDSAAAAPGTVTAGPATWILLSLIPASLLYGVTTLITTDMAAVPLLWIAPLALYLASYVIAFSRRGLAPFLVPAVCAPLLLLGLTLWTGDSNLGSLLRPAMHLSLFFVVATVLHRRLADTRPPSAQLTAYFLYGSFGGLLGGVLNGILAPLVFRGVGEYPIALALAVMVLGQSALERREPRARRLIVGLLLALTLGAIALLFDRVQRQGFEPLVLGFVFALLARQALRLPWEGTALALAVLVLLPAAIDNPQGRAISLRRSFFGVHRLVALDKIGCRVLIHGTTIHGCQSMAEERRREPLTYYSRRGPIGDVFAALEGRGELREVRLVGLGAGAICAYARAGQRWTLYEIDPMVVEIAKDPAAFTFVADMPLRPEIVVGDGRLSLEREQGPPADLIVIDAFSSGSIPVHMLTREAFEVYLSRLAPGGLIALHISNGFIHLEPVVTAAARELGLICRARRHGMDSAIDRRGVSPSRWIVVARRDEDFAGLRRRSGWNLVEADAHQRAWTDDRASIIPFLRVLRDDD